LAMLASSLGTLVAQIFQSQSAFDALGEAERIADFLRLATHGQALSAPQLTQVLERLFGTRVLTRCHGRSPTIVRSGQRTTKRGGVGHRGGSGERRPTPPTYRPMPGGAVVDFEERGRGFAKRGPPRAILTRAGRPTAGAGRVPDWQQSVSRL